MGHTTRCVPIIRHLQRRGHTVLLAGNKRQIGYWSLVFPDILTLPLQGYDVQYGATGIRGAVLRQLPKIRRMIRLEHEWLLKVAADHKPDAIISDNRYGLRHPALPSVIITHQLRIRSGLGSLADSALQKAHYYLLNRFSACWVPDVEGGENLAGRLSHPGHLPQNTYYLGLLSALRASTLVAGDHLLILLSGPEPQRSLLSQMLWKEAAVLHLPIIFVEGDPDAVRHPVPPHIRWYAQLSGAPLQAALEAASLIICRSGYSTLMDIALMGKKAILIPTPGQTEQEYLAAHLAKKKYALAFPQKGFSLSEALAAADHFAFRRMDFEDARHLYGPVIDAWLSTLA